MTMNLAKIATTKDYELLFGVTLRSAERMISEDRKMANTKRITLRYLAEKYFLLPEDFTPLFQPIPAKTRHI